MKEMKFKRIKDIPTAIRIYYMYPEIGTAEMKQLFGEDTSSATISRYKNVVREKQSERGKKTASANTVITEIAYEVWGIDIRDLERRMKKLQQLGFIA